MVLWFLFKQLCATRGIFYYSSDFSSSVLNAQTGHQPVALDSLWISGINRAGIRTPAPNIIAVSSHNVAGIDVRGVRAWCAASAAVNAAEAVACAACRTAS